MPATSKIPRANSRTVAIVGAGAIGLSCAIHLQRAGFAVEIFDPRGPGEGCSSGNAGVIATAEVLPFGRPSILRQVPRMLFDPLGPLVIRWGYLPRFAPWLLRFIAACRPGEVERLAQAITSLLVEAVPSWREIVKGTDGERLLVSRGWLRLYGSKSALEAALPEAMWRRELGVKVDILKGGEIRELEPALAPIFEGAILFPEVGHTLSPLGLMRVLAAIVAQNGGRFHRRHISRIEIENGRAAVIDEADTSHAFDRAVIAAGAWSRHLVRTLGIDVPLDTERGYHVMLPTPAASPLRPVSVMSPGYSLIQMEEGLRLVTGIEFAGLQAPPDFRRIRRLVAHAATVLPGLKAEPMSEWLGFRPSMPTSIPVIGPIPGRPEVMLAFGHGHLGLTLGPATGRLVAALMEGKTPFADVAPFLPANAAI
ncbi:MAG: FAD-binding oxidoreductase [Rhodospirillales bacterium]|nr:FAD-binding oxidoreductase [Rhodospirillales bacterium]